MPPCEGMLEAASLQQIPHRTSLSLSSHFHSTAGIVDVASAGPAPSRHSARASHADPLPYAMQAVRRVGSTATAAAAGAACRTFTLQAPARMMCAAAAAAAEGTMPEVPAVPRKKIYSDLKRCVAAVCWPGVPSFSAQARCPLPHTPPPPWATEPRRRWPLPKLNTSSTWQQRWRRSGRPSLASRLAMPLS